MTPGTRPIGQKPYRDWLQHRQRIVEHVTQMLAAEVIEHAQSDWASPIFIAPKKDGSARFFMDTESSVYQIVVTLLQQQGGKTSTEWAIIGHCYRTFTDF